ncbi:MAG: hypothetical protein IKD43_03970 [Clostridia bacterium]|nr:hypothetical protein [Clostridia bacterium]
MCYNNFSDAAKGKKTEGDMFGGRVDHQLDEKNRMRIPKMYLEGFPNGEELYFVEYAPGCISIMPQSVRDRRLAPLEDFNPGDEEMMDAARRIFSSIMPVEKDNQGRTKIPKMFREIAGLKKDIVTVGFMDYIEVWDKDRYEFKHSALSLSEANKRYYSRKKSGEDA